MLLWSALILSYISLELNWTRATKYAIATISIIAIIVLQHVKADFRDSLDKNPDKDAIVLLWNSLSDAFSAQAEGRLESRLGIVNARLNQGWIISATMLHVPAIVEFQEGGTIISAIRDVLVPRFLVEKKPVEKKPVPKGTAKGAAEKKPPVKVAAAGYTANLKRGQKLYRAGKLKAAAQSLEKALEANPRGAAALVALANVYFEMDRNKQAVDMAKRALAINPRNARAHLTLGTIYQTMGKNGLAKKSYQQYLKLEPKGRFAQDVRSILKSLD